MEQRDRKIKEQEDIINSIKHEMIQINNRNKDLEHTLKKDNVQLLQKSTQLNQKIQTESEMSRTITSLKRKTQCLSQELLDSIKEKDRQQHALNQLHDKEAELKRTIISLNTSIQHLEKEVDDRDMLDNKIEIPNANELELNTQLKERDDQLSELSIQLQHTLEQMQETETAFDARVTSQRKKMQHLKVSWSNVF
ncbi:uncharacterized protein LOC128557338 [Mercenaria mercenaria]|uniref:uncharacterized protein LOC128557338 n=1 Tax=Mercenaria mercenaria TaxID=6596 RepID=UPI00234F6CAB|nr:uncharacterized protein LOC128557338 [Mercenaria mercenaria]